MSPNQSHPTIGKTSKKKGWFRIQYAVQCLLVTASLWMMFVFQSHSAVLSAAEQQRIIMSGKAGRGGDVPITTDEMHNDDMPQTKRTAVTKQTKTTDHAWNDVLQRSGEHAKFCEKSDPGFQGFDKEFDMLWNNQTLPTLPPFGIREAIQKYTAQRPEVEDAKWKCVLPPETECQETQLTAVFMAYNPDRLGKTLNEIRRLTNPSIFHNLVKECILVWNGPRHVDESPEGKQVLEFAKTNPLRIVYPLKMGFPNDLMNRYHPDVVQVTTKAILYYDDDGPFYSFKAIESGFELWKRHSRVQMGAMSRKIDYSARQSRERWAMDPEPNDKLFVSHCDNLRDKVEYNFRFFANYDANMVLPSGSMLHSNYLCFLWHPILEEVRQFVLAHPVHPDDITVSTVVSHLAGQAPRVYSRRLNPDDTKKEAKPQRRLEEEVPQEEVPQEEVPPPKQKGGIGGICWDCNAGMTEKKKIWAELRSQAINSLIKYFGSINSGSIGWCEGTSHYVPQKSDGRCKPIMARIGWLPWMQPDGLPKETCP